MLLRIDLLSLYDSPLTKDLCGGLLVLAHSPLVGRCPQIRGRNARLSRSRVERVSGWPSTIAQASQP